MDEDKNFQHAVAFVLKCEGGYVNNPNDPGGETKFGISRRAFPMLDIRNLTEEDAREIYYKQYWIKASCDKLVWPMNLIVFDAAVNCGVERSLRFYREAPDDWNYCLELRRNYYRELGKRKPMFLRGWLNRCNNLQKEAEKEIQP